MSRNSLYSLISEAQLDNNFLENNNVNESLAPLPIDNDPTQRDPKAPEVLQMPRDCFTTPPPPSSLDDQATINVVPETSHSFDLDLFNSNIPSFDCSWNSQDNVSTSQNVSSFLILLNQLI